MLDPAILQEKFAQGILEITVDKGQAVAKVQPEAIFDVLKFCKEDPAFAMNMLMDIVAVDFLGQSPRFEVVYLLYSIEKKHRIRLKVRVEDGQTLPTAIPLYKSADWAEREIFDMLGIGFTGHPNLKRILMFEGFEGHPLRRDYPMNFRQKIPEVQEIP